MIDRDQGVISSLIIFAITVMVVLAMTGCSTVVPVAAKFPAPPDRAGNAVMTACPQLQELESAPKLSDISRTININYSTYYQCAVKVDTWIEWYHSQKNIFESAGK